MLEGFEFLEVFVDESVVDFEGSVVRVEVKKGFVFVSNDKFVAGGEIIDEALIVIEFVDDVDGTFFLCVDVAEVSAIVGGEENVFVDELDGPKGQFQDITGLGTSNVKRL